MDLMRPTRRAAGAPGAPALSLASESHRPPSRGKPRLVGLAFAWIVPLVGLVVLPSPSRADVFSAFGTGARSAALAGGGAALAEDFTAMYLCPAGMAFGPPSIGVGFGGGLGRLKIRLSPRPPGYDIPDLGADSPAVPYRYRLQPRANPDTDQGLAGFTVGASASLGLDWLRVGALAFVPLVGMGDEFTYYPDEREQYFSNTLHYEIYGDQLVSQLILVGGSVRLLDWLSVGGGVRLNFEPHTNAQVMTPHAADQTTQYMNVHVETGVQASPILSVAARLLAHRLKLSLTYRDESYLPIRGQTAIQIAGFQGTDQYPFYQHTDLLVHYAPRQVVAAAAWEDRRFGVALDATWNQWSIYRDNHDVPAGFSDSWTASLGGELRPSNELTLRGGFGYRQSPVPDQTGRSNFVDNSLLRFAVGAGYMFHFGTPKATDRKFLPSPAGPVGKDRTLEVSAFVQLQFAIPRETVKTPQGSLTACGPGVTTICDEVPDDAAGGDPRVAGLQTGNPGFPGYTSGGWIAMGGLQAIWRY